MDRRRAAAGVLAAALLTGCAGGSSEPAPGSQRRPSAAPSDPASKHPSARPSPTVPEGAATPTPPDSPRAAAAQILAAERVIGERRTSTRELAMAAHSQQLVYRELGDRPGWDRRVLELLPRSLRGVVTDNVAARRAFRSMHPTRPSDLATELPAWRIVAPRPAAELRNAYRAAERRYGVDWEYLAAINLVETGFGRIKGTSVAGAQGPMQFIPATWDRYGHGGDVHDPHDAIPAAARLLRDYGFAGDPASALYHYNNSSSYVRGVTLYAELMQRRPPAYLGYHQWQIYYLTRRGSILLPEGYAERRPLPVRQWLARSSR
ncbi:transglycosylase SLT domain-containing protein [Nocardioides sp.]|uniref:lytic transglycosylase domain-containing protein n=1 Tax=Nocardioides sp. TaxID=35761 RepID=UPI002ED2CCE7